MTFIYSFLQKRKMHESQHGITMVVIAYILSALMLVLGSDIFYNINTAAAGVSAETKEETKQIIGEDKIEQNNNAISESFNLVNPYNLTDLNQNQILTEDDTSSEDTVWFLGNAMDNKEYDKFLTGISRLLPKTNVKKEVLEKQKSATSKKQTKIETLSVKTTSGSKKVTISESEITMLERIVQAEAGGEDMVGKILIANVIFNRIVDGHFAHSVEGVIFQKSDGDYQFSPVESGRYWDVRISSDTKEAVERALDGEDYSQGALYFIARKHSASTNARWFDNNLDWLFKHGGHEFYR